MRILELTGEPIGTGGQEMFIINLLRHIDLTDLQIPIEKKLKTKGAE